MSSSPRLASQAITTKRSSGASFVVGPCPPRPRYLWATDGEMKTPMPMKVGETIGDRYRVMAPNIWLDTQPDLQPPVFNAQYQIQGQPIPTSAVPYLKLQAYALHLPTLYDICPPLPLASIDHPPPEHLPDSGAQALPHALVLDNVPIDDSGCLFPSLQSAWSKVSPIRQLYWLWQLAELWHPLDKWGQSASLLVPDNIRVDGWRVRLVELWNRDQMERISDSTQGELGADHQLSQPLLVMGGPTDDSPPALHQILGSLWQTWVVQGHPSLMAPLAKICETLQEQQISWPSIKDELNQLLLEHVAQRPLWLTVASGMAIAQKEGQDTGTCYPPVTRLTTNDTNNDEDGGDGDGIEHRPQTQRRNQQSSTHRPGSGPIIESDTPEYDVSGVFKAPAQWEALSPHVALVCEGLGEHPRTETASQLVMRSLKLQIAALLAEVEVPKANVELIPPEIVMDQLTATLRIVNNVLVAQNNSYHLTDAERMSATAVLAVQLPQVVTTSHGLRNSHELYLASVGDGRAYWLTETACHCLIQNTVLTTRTRGTRDTVESAERLHTHRDTLPSADAHTLIPSLGIQEGEQLAVQVKRLIIEEDGVLLLCSKGLSQGDRVETYWQSITTPVLQGTWSLEQAVQAWLQVANPFNNHDVNSHDSHDINNHNSHDVTSHNDTSYDAAASVVLMRCRVSSSQRAKEGKTRGQTQEHSLAQGSVDHHIDVDHSKSDISLVGTANSRAIDSSDASSFGSPPMGLLTPEQAIASNPDTASPPSVSRHWMQLLIGYGVSILSLLVLGLTIWRYAEPVSFDRVVIQHLEQWLGSSIGSGRSVPSEVEN